VTRFDRRLLAGPQARAGVAAVALCGALQSLAVIAYASLLASMITEVFQHHATLASLRNQLIFFGLAVAGRAVLVWLAEGLGHSLAARLIVDLRSRSLRALMGRGPDQLSRHRTGELVALLTTGLDHLDAYFARFLPLTIVAATVPLAVIAYVFTIDWVSAVILLITVPLIPLFMVLIGWTAERAVKSRWQSFQQLGGHFLDVLQGLPTLRLFGRGPAQVERIRAMSRSLRHTTMETLRIAFLSALVLELLASLGVALLAVTIGVRLDSGGLGLRDGLVVLILAPEVYLPLRSLGGAFHGSMEGLEAATRVLELTQEEEAAPPQHATLTAPSAAAAVSFNQVTFAHPDRPAVLSDASFGVAAGERALLCAPSGAGKTTTLGLVLGILEPQEGHVLVSGADAVGLRRQSCGPVISWLPQQPHIFSGTLGENVRLGAPGAPDADVSGMLRHVGAGFVDDLGGLDATVGDRGLTLSGGQRQRVAVARTLLRQGDILLLDEPLAHLDPSSRAVVSAAIEASTRGRTVIVAAHVAADFPWVDRVITLPGSHPAPEESDPGAS
jgi:ATP-binding cassette subfamily C protein CydCD